MRLGSTFGSGLLLAALAAAGPLQAQSVLLHGLVFDAATGSPVPGALVSAVSGSDTLARVRTGPLGGFMLEFEAAGPFTLRAERDGYRPAVRDGLGPSGRNLSNMLVELQPVDPVEVVGIGPVGAAPARVLGRVRDAETGRPVPGAEVRIETEVRSVRTVTDGKGSYTLSEVPPGTPSLVVEALGYQAQQRMVAFAAGGSYRVEIRIRPDAVEIPGFQVQAIDRGTFKRWDGLYWRISRDLGGHFILAEELEARGHPPLFSTLTSLPSVDIRSPDPRDPFEQRVYLRNCLASIWIDGLEVFNADDDGPTMSLAEFLRVSTVDIEAIEVYPGAASLPPEFNSPGTMCALVLWTKRGN